VRRGLVHDPLAESSHPDDLACSDSKDGDVPDDLPHEIEPHEGQVTSTNECHQEWGDPLRRKWAERDQKQKTQERGESHQHVRAYTIRRKGPHDHEEALGDRRDQHRYILIPQAHEDR